MWSSEWPHWPQVVSAWTADLATGFFALLTRLVARAQCRAVQRVLAAVTSFLSSLEARRSRHSAAAPLTTTRHGPALRAKRVSPSLLASFAPLTARVSQRRSPFRREARDCGWWLPGALRAGARGVNSAGGIQRSTGRGAERRSRAAERPVPVSVTPPAGENGAGIGPQRH